MMGFAKTFASMAIMASQEVHSWSSISQHAAIAFSNTRTSFASPSSMARIPSSPPSSSSATALRSRNGNNDGELQSQIPSMGLNELQTQFRQAIAREDMDAAILYQDELADRVSSGAHRARSDDDDDDAEEEARRKRRRLSWAGLGTAPWLIERLQALEYPLPTTIQINSFEAVNAILSGAENASPRNNVANDDDTLEERLRSQTPQNMGVVVSGSTGSGKTLAYLVPALSTLSQTLFTRQRIRIKAEEDVGDIMGDLLDRVMVQTSPSMRGQGYDQVGGKGASLTGAAVSSLGKSGTDVRSPVALIVVPTRELGVQIALLLFELVGGNRKTTATERSGKKNMFRYKGPKGVKIGCVLDKQKSDEGLKLQTDIAIVTPKYLTKLIEDNEVDPSKLRVVIYDEADLGLEQTSEDNLKLLFDKEESKREFSRISYLVGATVTESLGNLAVKDEILPEGKSFISTATRFAPLTREDGESTEDDPTTTLRDLGLCLDPGLRHERVVAPDGAGLLCLARLLRRELREYEAANATLADGGDDDDADEDDPLKQLATLREETKDLEEDPDLLSLYATSDADTVNALQRPRVVVFLPDEDAARDAVRSLRDAVWGEHRLGVLLPDTGAEPLTIMESFNKGDITVLLATPNSVRGLDFPALTHVYTLFLPANDPREYLHLAGRVGRIGQQGSVRGQGGRVTTILGGEEASQFDELAQHLGFEFIDVEPIQAEVTQESDVEDMRRYLEDTITLLGTADEPKVTYSDADDDDDDDADDDDDDED